MNSRNITFDPANSLMDGRLNRIDCAILAELAAGYSQNVAARRLGMSPRTIRRKLNDICRRIEARSSIEAVAWAARRHLI